MLKAKIVDIQKQSEQIDIIVVYTTEDPKGNVNEVAKNVYTIPYTDYQNFDEQGIIDLITKQGQKYKVTFEKADELSKTDLIGKEIEI